MRRVVLLGLAALLVVGDDSDWVKRVIEDAAEQVRRAGVPDEATLPPMAWLALPTRIERLFSLRGRYSDGKSGSQ